MNQDERRFELWEGCSVPNQIYYAETEDIERLSEDVLIIFNLHLEYLKSGKIDNDTGMYALSRDNGETWRIQHIWNADLDRIRKIEKNRPIAFKKRKEYEEKHGEKIKICYSCSAEGELGIMRFNRYEMGTESQTKVWVDDAGIEQSGDVSYSCRYRIEKCDRCGAEDSDYG